MRTPATGSPGGWPPRRRARRSRTRSAAHVLGPAGMASAGFDEPDLPGSGRGATTAPYPRARRPSGGLVADVADVIRFGRWQLAEPWTAALRQPLAQAGRRRLRPRLLRRAGRRRRGVGASRLLRRLPVEPAARPDRGRRLRRPDLQRRAARAPSRELENLWFERLLGARRRRRETVELPTRRSRRSPAPTRTTRRQPSSRAAAAACSRARHRGRRDVRALGATDRRAHVRGRGRRRSRATGSTSRSTGSRASGSRLAARVA